MLKYKTFSLSTIGSSHIAKGKPIEDFATNTETATCAIIIVCDGHGGADYIRSGMGAELLALAARERIGDFLAQIENAQIENSVDENAENADTSKKGCLSEEKERQKRFMQLEKSIIANWIEKITDDLKVHPFTEEELATVSEKAKRKYTQAESGEKEYKFHAAYGTTLIAVAMTKNFWFALHIGDGRCVVCDEEGKFSQPVPWDEDCVGAATSSICDDNAILEFRNFYSEKMPQAIFVATDGVEDCFSGIDSEEKMYHFYDTIKKSFVQDNTNWDDAIEELKNYLPIMSAAGSHDDISVAGIIRLTD